MFQCSQPDHDSITPRIQNKNGLVISFNKKEHQSQINIITSSGQLHGTCCTVAIDFGLMRCGFSINYDKFFSSWMQTLDYSCIHADVDMSNSRQKETHWLYPMKCKAPNEIPGTFLPLRLNVLSPRYYLKAIWFCLTFNSIDSISKKFFGFDSYVNVSHLILFSIHIDSIFWKRITNYDKSCLPYRKLIRNMCSFVFTCIDYPGNSHNLLQVCFHPHICGFSPNQFPFSFRRFP